MLSSVSSKQVELHRVSNLDKLSVRNEVSRLKADFELLCRDGNVSREVQILMNSMFMIIELILSIFLERTTKKASHNSSRPSSQTEKDDSALAHPGSQGKGKVENETQVGNTRTKESVTRVQFCDVCGENLSSAPCLHHERRTKIDIIFEKVFEHVDAQIKPCPVCDAAVKGAFPADLHGPLQYGGGLKAFVINLMVCQMAAVDRVQKLVYAMIGVMMAEATLLQFVLRLHLALEQWEHRATQQILLAPSLQVDETSLRVDKKNQWIHVYSAGEITLKFLHRKRGTGAIESINIIPHYGGVIIHDCWSSYLTYDHVDHGLCGSHLLRELTFIIEAHDYAWTRQMKRVLQKSCKAVSESPEKRLSEEALAPMALT